MLAMETTRHLLDFHACIVRKPFLHNKKILSDSRLYKKQPHSLDILWLYSSKIMTVAIAWCLFRSAVSLLFVVLLIFLLVCFDRNRSLVEDVLVMEKGTARFCWQIRIVVRTITATLVNVFGRLCERDHRGTAVCPGEGLFLVRAHGLMCCLSGLVWYHNTIPPYFTWLLPVVERSSMYIVETLIHTIILTWWWWRKVWWWMTTPSGFRSSWRENKNQ